MQTIFVCEEFAKYSVYQDGILLFHPNFIQTIIRVKIILANRLKKLLNTIINLQTLQGIVVTYAIGYYIVYFYINYFFIYCSFILLQYL